MKKALIIIFSILIGIVFIYYSVYFEKLDIKKQQELVKKFNPKELVDYFWKNELNKTLEKAISLNEFDSLLNVNPAFLANKFGKTVGISSYYSVLVKGKGKVKKDEQGNLIIKWNGKNEYKIATRYIFSNTARDASGFFDIDFFENTMDYNAVSTELNARIIKEVIAGMPNLIVDDSFISFIGAIGFSTESNPKELEIVPLKLEIIKK
jgi:predicted lipoprotein